MKKICFVAVVILISLNSFSQDLTNASVISMLKKGLSESIVKAKIKQSVCNFDLSTEALISLKENKVSEGVIMAMIEKSDQQNSSSPQNQTSTTKNLNVTYNASLQTQTNKKRADPDKVLNPKYQEEVNRVLPNLYESGIFIYDSKEKHVFKIY